MKNTISKRGGLCIANTGGRFNIMLIQEKDLGQNVFTIPVIHP